MKSARFLLSVIFTGILMLSINTANATKWNVSVQNFSFSPSNLPSVNVGDTIRWVWVSGTHTTTSSTIPGGAASWNAPITSTNTSYEYPVTVAGNYNYVCTPHAGMGMVGSFTATVANPVLLSISPNQALQGASFTATITGSSTNFTGNPAVSLTFSGNPNEIINATGVTVVSPTVLHAQFTIPVSASPGLWTLHVNSLALLNSFTVIQAVPAILSISPNGADQGESFTGNIIGQYTSWTGTSSVYLSFSGNPGEIITGTNITVTNSTHISADFSIPFNASPGLYTVHVDALQLVNAFTVVQVEPTISFMSPNFAHQGDAFTASVFGNNTTWTGTPTVYLAYVITPAEVINGTNVVVINGTELSADFSIPADASVGNYTLHVDGLSQSSAFTVLSALIPALSGISPDNGEQGSLVSATITAENTTFTGGNPAVSLSLTTNPFEIITATNVVVLNNTSLSADFNIPYEATPGLWNLNVDELMLENSFTVVDVIPYLVSMSPNAGTQGEMVTTTITAADSRFTLSVPYVVLSFSMNPGITVTALNVNVISDTQIEAVFIIPSAALPGLWDLHVDEMLLPQAFTVLLLSGIGDPVKGIVKIYPNPASSNINILNAAGSELNVYNILGENVLSYKVNSEMQVLDISNLARGTYVIRIKKDGNIVTEKLQKN